MKSIPQYHFYRTKYGDELLIDVVELRSIKKYIEKDPIHILTYYDITLITEDSGEYIINDCIYHLKPGDVIFTKPGEVRGWKDSHHLNGYALIFEEEFLLSFFNDAHFLKNLTYFNTEKISFRLHLNEDINSRILLLFHHIKKEIDNDSIKDHHILRAMLYEVLMLLNRAYLQSNTRQTINIKNTNRHFHAFIRLVDSEFMVQKHTSYYADKLYITPNYLNETVRNTLGISAKVYIQNKVMQEAKRLLNYTTLSIAEIGDKLHYATSSYFVRAFHKHNGLTPKQYRDSQNIEK